MASYKIAGEDSILGGYVGASVLYKAEDHMHLVADIEVGGDGTEDYFTGTLGLNYSW